MTQRPNRELLAVLRQRWPNCFKDHRPLKLGIHHDILATLPDLGLDQVEVERALANYTRKLPYLEQMLEGTPRIDLDGHVVGAVTAAHAAGAQSCLPHVRRQQEQWLATLEQQRQEQREARKAAAQARKQQKRAAAAAAAPPPRLGIEGLRKAALERRAAAR
jgi:sRNA-binding protein